MNYIPVQSGMLFSAVTSSKVRKMMMANMIKIIRLYEAIAELSSFKLVIIYM